jgi:hypothetical protein
MRPIAPRIDGADEVTIAEEQHEYMTITAALVEYPDGSVHRVCRWTLTPEERSAIFLGGDDIYFGTPANVALMPHWLVVGWPANPPEPT